MHCEEMTERLTDKLNGVLDDRSARELDHHLTACATCRDEASGIEGLWNAMGDLSEDVPSDRMRARFHGALEAYGEGRRLGWAGRLNEALERWWPRQPVAQVGLAVGALLVGLLLGGRFTAIAPAPAPDADGTLAEIRALREQMEGQMETMHRTVSLSLLEHQSASERLRGVEWSARAEPDDRVVSALLEAVDHDPSVNVRLAAIEALGPLVDRPAVGRQLLQSLKGPAPAIVRVGLAEMLLVGNVDGSTPAVERMLDDTELEPVVREHLRDLMRRSS